MAQLGTLFDIDALGGGLYGYKAYRILFQTVSGQDLKGCHLSDGDTNATLHGAANHYCIAVESSNRTQLAAIRSALSRSNAQGLVPVAARFLEDAQVRAEPLVQAGYFNGTGELVGDKAGWITAAWNDTKQPELGVDAPTAVESKSPSMGDGNREPALQTAQPVTKAPPPAVAERKQGGCLRAYLVLAILGNVGVGVFLLTLLGEASPDGVGFVLLLALLSLVAAGFAWAVFKWKRWGVYGLGTVIGISSLISLLDGDLLNTLRGLVPVVILVALIRPIWEQME